MRNADEIMNELLNLPLDNDVRMLVKELCNACGSATKGLKNAILSEALAESETIPGREDEVISLDVLQEIVMTAGDNL